MMKTLYLTLLFVSFAAFQADAACCSDDWKLIRDEADRYFDLEQYHMAIKLYSQLENGGKEDGGVTYRLAECYRKTFNYSEAESYYFKVSRTPSAEFKLAVYYYGLMLKLNGSYQESITYLDEFILKNQNNSELLDYVDQAMIDRAGSEAALSDAISPSDRYKITCESVNSAFNDFSPAMADSTRMIITSGRTMSSLKAIDERYGESFTDNFYFERVAGTWQDRTRQSIRNLNTKFNDGSGCFNKNKYYFTVCGQDGSQCKIVVSELRNGRWSDPKTLNDNVNIDGFEAKHPAISPGGDTLLFVSNRRGGFGGFDIWMSIDAAEQDWGPAMNIGSAYNTKMNEIAPSFAGFNHVFFFASDGHQGFGGMDIYLGKRFSDGRQSVYNLGYPFNSNRDDCFASFTDSKMYMSSNREGGKGGFDIYSAFIQSPLSFISRLSLKNQSGRQDIHLATLRSEGSWMDLFASRREDRIEYENLTYERKKIVDKMIAGKVAHKEAGIEQFSGMSEDEYTELEWIAQRQFKKLELQQKYKTSYLGIVKANGELSSGVTGVLVDSLTGKPMASVNIYLMNEQGEVIKATSTNHLGIFRFTNVAGTENLYLRYENQLASNAKPVVRDLLAVRDNGDTFTFDNIYFDTDHYRLRPEAKEALDKLGEFLKLMPDAQVEIYAYADDRGSDSYNLQLTKKRGEVVRMYLGSIGVDETAVAIIARGRQVQNDDVNNEDKRQFNRRVEFYINGEKFNSLITADRYK